MDMDPSVADVLDPLESAQREQESQVTGAREPLTRVVLGLALVWCLVTLLFQMI
jgi:preprotein translocase subunit SecG